MKKTASLTLVALLMLSLLGACSSPAAKETSPEDYAAVITSLRSEQENMGIPVVTSADDKQFPLIVEPFFSVDDMDTFAISVSMMIVKAYGVAIIMPKEGRQDAVVEQANAFIESKKKECESYLPDQYQIAKDAKVVTMSTGEVILVMSDGGAALLADMKKAWTAK